MKKTLAILLLAAPALAGGRVTRPADNGLTTRTVQWGEPQSDMATTVDQSMSMTDSWHWGGGITHTVTTFRHDNESVATWAKRHKEAVDAALQLFPPDHQ